MPVTKPRNSVIEKEAAGFEKGVDLLKVCGEILSPDMFDDADRRDLVEFLCAAESAVVAILDLAGFLERLLTDALLGKNGLLPR